MRKWIEQLGIILLAVGILLATPIGNFLLPARTIPTEVSGVYRVVPDSGLHPLVVALIGSGLVLLAFGILWRIVDRSINE